MQQRADRQDKKLVSAWVTREKWKKLRHIVTETERPANDLIDEAIDMLAEKYPTPPAGTKPARRRTSPER
jgi:hypothetical protein